MEINSQNKRLKQTNKTLLQKALHYKIPINIYGTHPHTLISPHFFTIDLRQYTDLSTLIYTVHLTSTHLQYTEGLLTTACKYGYVTVITHTDTNPSIIDYLKPLFNGLLNISNEKFENEIQDGLYNENNGYNGNGLKENNGYNGNGLKENNGYNGNGLKESDNNTSCGNSTYNNNSYGNSTYNTTPLNNNNTINTPLNNNNTINTPLTNNNTINTPLNNNNTINTPLTNNNTINTPLTNNNTINTPLNNNNTINTLSSILSPFYNPHPNFRIIFTSSTKLQSNNTVHIGPVTYTLPLTPLISLLNTFYPFNKPPTLQDTYFITRLTNRLQSLSLYTAIQQTYIITLKTLKEQKEVEEKIKGFNIEEIDNNTPLVECTYNNTPLNNRTYDNTPYSSTFITNTPLNNNSINNTPLNNKYINNTPLSTTIINNTPSFAPTSQSLVTLSALSSCILYNEPVLLIGETGVGKTHLIQHLSNINNKYLYIYNMSSDTDVSDLLGFYTSVHPISVIEEYVGNIIKREINETPLCYLERIERYINDSRETEGVNDSREEEGVNDSSSNYK
ncbi:hypothetical protein CWI36_1671p0010, partial [Hamiltosporidium magnivora]